MRSNIDNPSAKSNVNVIRQEALQAMLSRLEWMMIEPQRILVLGVEGFNEEVCEKLKQRYSQAEILVEIKQNKSQTFDLILANLVLPWHDNMQEMVSEWKQLLREEGLLMISAFGPDTLVELGSGIQDLMIPRLTDMHDIGDCLVRARLADPVLDVSYCTLSYDNGRQMLQELEEMQMVRPISNAIDIKAFEVTFEIIQAHAWQPAEDYFPSEEGIASIPISHLRARLKRSS